MAARRKKTKQCRNMKGMDRQDSFRGYAKRTARALAGFIFMYLRLCVYIEWGQKVLTRFKNLLII